MSEVINRYLRGRDLRFHFFAALAAGLVLRTLSAIFVYGPLGVDDYDDGIWPAYQMYAHLPVAIPDYRSHLLNWLLLGFLKTGHVFGVESALGQVRVEYFGLGLLSCLAIWGAFVYCSCFRSRAFGALALYLMAIYPLMPLVSTRAFGESVALAFVVSGLALCERARISTRSGGEMFAGFFVLGMAVLFRFQVGVIACAYALTLLLLREWRLSVALVVSGFFLLAAEAGIDLLSDRAPFATLRAYLLENSDGGAKYGVFPWYNTWLVILALVLFPFVAVFARYFRFLLARHGPLMICLFAFVLVHSLVPHKEERFMYPVIGLLLIGLAWVWTLGRHDRRVKRLYSPVFLVVTAVVLPITCFVNSQAGEVEPAVVAERDIGPSLYIYNRSLMPGSFAQLRFFARPPSRILRVAASEMNLEEAGTLVASIPELKGAVLLTTDPSEFDRIQAMSLRDTPRLRCGRAMVAASLADRLIYRLNPAFNERKAPALYVMCARR